MQKKIVLPALVCLTILVVSIAAYIAFRDNTSFHYIDGSSIAHHGDKVSDSVEEKFFAQTLSVADVALYDQKLADPKLSQKERDFYNFEKSKLLGMYGKDAEKFSILTSLVNAEGTEKSIRTSAAYDVLHTYFDDGDLDKVLRAIKDSPYMSRYTQVLQSRNSKLLIGNPETMKREQKDLLFMEYLDVAGEDEFSLAIAATAADMYGQYYQLIKPVAKKEVADVLLSKSLGNYRRATSILNGLKKGSYQLPASDVVVGFNHMAAAMERYEKEGVTYAGGYAIEQLFEDSVSLSKTEAPNLYAFTTYLQAIHLSNKSNLIEKDLSVIKSNLAFIYGGKLSPTSFSQRLIDAKNSQNEVFGKVPVVRLANFDEGLKVFLLKNGWSTDDFK